MFSTENLFPGRVVALCLGLILGLAGGTLADYPPLWGELEPGPYGVGFRTIEKYDFSRTYRPSRDYFGEPLEGETARPIQVCIWYPAAVDSSAMSMVYAEYSYPYPEDGSFVNFLNGMQNLDLTALFACLNNSQPLVLSSMDLELTGIRDAEPLAGPFPLIIYHGDNRVAYCQNLVLCEYLASHGYVVATTHTFGTRSAAVTANGDDFESAVRDKEFVATVARDLPYVDLTKQGVIGTGFGGATALIYQMRHPESSALATIDGAFRAADEIASVMANPFYSAQALLTPWLCVYGTVDGQPNGQGLLDSLRHSRRSEISFTAYRPQNLNTYALIAEAMAPDTTLEPGVARLGHDLTCRAVLSFFDGTLKGDGNRTAVAGLEAAATLSEFAAEPVPPDPQQFADIIRVYGMERAVTLVDQFDLVNPDHPILPSQNFTNLGYAFIRQGAIDDALTAFRWGITAYPTAANGWDSYGEACAANGDIAMALECYRKAFEMIPVDNTLTPQFRALLEGNIPGIIEGLEQRLAEQSTNGE